MENQELHIIALSGDRNPIQDSNGERIQSAAEKIVGLLKPASLWVVSAPEDNTYQTADFLNGVLESSSLDQVAKNNSLREGAIDNENPDEWLMYLQVMNHLALLKSKNKNPANNKGLVLVTYEDIVEQIPEALGEDSYEDKTNTDYVEVNHITLKVDDLGRLASQELPAK